MNNCKRCEKPCGEEERCINCENSRVLRAIYVGLGKFERSQVVLIANLQSQIETVLRRLGEPVVLEGEVKS